MTESAAARPAAGRMTFNPRLGGVTVGALCLLLALVLDAVLRHETGFPSGDGPYYARMAAHPGGPHNFPYAFRVGVPYLVHVLPFTQSFSWRALALLSAATAGGALFALLREFEIEPRVAAGLSLAFAVSPPLLVVFLRNGLMVDATAIAVITLGCLFVVRRQRVALGLTLLVAITVHESCLFLIPLAYAVWAERPLDGRAARDLATVAVVPVALYLYLRSSIVAVGEIYQPGYTGPFFQARIDVLRDALSHGGWAIELRRLFLDYGLLWVAAPLALRTLPFARRGLVLVVLCGGAALYALDWGRMMFFAAPVFYVAGAHAMRDRPRLSRLVLASLVAIDVGYALFMQLHGVVHGLDSTGPPGRGPVS